MDLKNWFHFENDYIAVTYISYVGVVQVVRFNSYV